MSLETPNKIRELQRKLYRKAKEEPAYRFYLLYDKIHREDIFRHAYALAKANAGAPGVDQESFSGIETKGWENWLEELRKELQAKTYKPQPVRRVMIPKPGGGERPLGIPTIRDRVVQTALKLVVEPSAYGYRPAERSAQEAIRQVHKLVCAGYTDIVDADLSKYFDTIPHSELLKSVARRIIDRDVLHLIKMWWKAPVEERDEKGNRRMTGGKGSKQGTPQGGVASPMLANLYMNRFLKYWRITERGSSFRAEVVNYADDFVILSRGHAAEALQWTRGVMTKIGLVDPERGQNEYPASTDREVRLSGLHFWSAPLPEGWSLVFRSQSIEEEQYTISATGGRSIGVQQCGTVGGSAGPLESEDSRMVGVLFLWDPDAGVSSGR
ncbi:MAG: reverse transcriptase domain-containing protein [Alphaproteobacteria bacterium]